MIKISPSVLKEKIINYAQTLGLTNAEIAERLNEDYNANDKEKLNAQNVAALKKKLDIKGIKPKKKALFEFVEETPEQTLEIPELGVNDVTTQEFKETVTFHGPIYSEQN